MLDTYRLGEELKSLGFDFFSGVPCSSLKNLINYAINECDYVMAANEGEAVAISAGASLGGRKSVVLFQNSGLTNAVSPLTSLNFCFRIPVLGFVSLRGEPGIADEPQHELMGEITTRMLDTMKIRWAFLPETIEETRERLQEADQWIASNESFFFVVKKGALETVELREKKSHRPDSGILREESRPVARPSRWKALETICSLRDENTAFLATTGKTGRELYEIEDSAHNLYMVGSMGCISSLGLGAALVRRDRHFIAIDGDGALLMRLGSLATNAWYRPDNLLHILLDNQCHDSTGGQFTVSPHVNFVKIASAAGYPAALFAHDLGELKDYMEKWKKNPHLTFIHLKIEKGSKKDLGRPAVKPFQVKERLMDFLRQ